MKTFYFNTGVSISSGAPLMKGQEWSTNGVKIIPFDCENLPDNAVFQFAADSPKIEGHETYLVREIHNSSLLSKYAYFQQPK